MISLCIMMLSGCTVGVPVVATIGTEGETGSEQMSTSEVEQSGESVLSTENGESTEVATEESTEVPTEEPIEIPTEAPTEEPTEVPTEAPTEEPTEAPTEPKPTVPPYYIKVDRRANCVTVYGLDESGAYTVPIKYMICSVGSGQRTPTGVFTISDQYRWRALFSNTYGQYASRITGHILFHSVPYLTQSQDTLVPGTYNQLGTKASLGCIRLTCSDAKWIYDNCPPGTTVEIFDGPTTSVPEKPSALQIDPNSPYSGWDPTDPHPSNPWKTVPITINGVVDLMVECGKEVDLLSHVSALDIDGKTPLTITIQGNVDVTKCGSYTVTYSAVGMIGTTATVQATVTVVPVETTEAPPETETSSEDETLEDETLEETETTGENI